MDVTFITLGFIFGIMGFTTAVFCMVKVSKMQKILKDKGIAQ